MESLPAKKGRYDLIEERVSVTPAEGIADTTLWYAAMHQYYCHLYYLTLLAQT